MKKIIALLLCLLLVLGATACGGSGNSNSGNGGSGNIEQNDNNNNKPDGDRVSSLLSREEALDQGKLKGTLIIRSMEKGYGTDGLKKIAEQYMAVVNEEATVTVIPDGAIETSITNNLPLVGQNDTDIYFGSAANIANFANDSILNEEEPLLFDFTDFVDFWQAYDGEKDSLREELIPDVVSMLTTVDPLSSDKNHLFALPWIGAGSCGFVYNEDLFIEAGVKVPTTTDEMFEAFDGFLAYNELHKNDAGFKPIVPVIYPGGNAMAYWTYITYVWWAQYEGYDKFMQYWTLTEDGDVYNPVNTCYNQQGQLEALKVSEKLLSGKYVATGSDKFEHKATDKNFVEGDGVSRFAMTPNGDWFQNEASVACGYDIEGNFKIMKTPVLSAAAKKNGGVGNVGNYAFNLAPKHNIIVPSYSKELYLALDFLSYYFSEEGGKLFTQYSHSFIPRTSFNYEESELDELPPFVRSQLDIINSKNLKYIGEAEQLSPIRTFGGMSIVPQGMASPEKEMIGGKTAKEVFDAYNDYFDSHWDNYYESAGIEE